MKHTSPAWHPSGTATRDAVFAIEGIRATIDEISAISIAIAGVSQAETETGTAAAEVPDAADGLSHQARQLTAEVGSFAAEVRAA